MLKVGHVLAGFQPFSIKRFTNNWPFIVASPTLFKRHKKVGWNVNPIVFYRCVSAWMLWLLKPDITSFVSLLLWHETITSKPLNHTILLHRWVFLCNRGVVHHDLTDAYLEIKIKHLHFPCICFENLITYIGTPASLPTQSMQID